MDRAAPERELPRMESRLAPARRRYRLWGFALAVALLLVLAHGWLLRLVPCMLVIESPHQRADFILLLDGDRRVDWAAEQFHGGQVRGILLISERGQCAADLGIIPSHTDLNRTALLGRRVPTEAIEVLAGQAATRWEQARLLKSWLAQHPDARVLVLCQRLDSRHCRYVFSRVLDPATATQMQYLGLPDRMIDESSWWTSRHAMKSVFRAAIRLTYDWLFAESHQIERPAWNPDDYEKALR